MASGSGFFLVTTTVALSVESYLRKEGDKARSISQILIEKIFEESNTDKIRLEGMEERNAVMESEIRRAEIDIKAKESIILCQEKEIDMLKHDIETRKKQLERDQESNRFEIYSLMEKIEGLKKELVHLRVEAVLEVEHAEREMQKIHQAEIEELKRKLSNMRIALEAREKAIEKRYWEMNAELAAYRSSASISMEDAEYQDAPAETKPTGRLATVGGARDREQDAEEGDCANNLRKELERKEKLVMEAKKGEQRALELAESRAEDLKQALHTLNELSKEKEALESAISMDAGLFMNKDDQHLKGKSSIDMEGEIFAKSVLQLRKEAKRLGIKGYSRMKKEELIASLREHGYSP